MTAQRHSRRIEAGSKDQSRSVLLQATRHGALAIAMQRLLDPGWGDVRDPIERIFVLLGTFRRPLVNADGVTEGTAGSFAFGLDAANERVCAFFTACTDAVHDCLLQAGSRLPDGIDRLGLAEFVVATVNGASVQARAFRDVGYFDRAVRQLRAHFDLLLYQRPALPDHVREALPGR
jgi:hypothetical protein